MIDSLISLLAPHYCCSCGAIGSLLCESCKYDITSDPATGCVMCGKPSVADKGCATCRLTIQQTWHAGVRSGGLEKLIDQYKFNNARAAHATLGDLLLAILPDLPSETVIVPIPTIRPHVRQRGYDHTLLIAQYIAKRRNLVVLQLITRRTATVQRGADRRKRLLQAKDAFVVSTELNGSVPYLLVDDVVTTGATLLYGAKALRSAGAKTICAVAVARQPLDTDGKQQG